MVDALTDPFAQSIGQRALVEVALIGAVAGPLGVWVVLHRQSYAAESLAHAMLPGLVGAALLGVPLALGAAAGLLLAALAIAAAQRQRAIEPDVGVAVAVTVLLGLGAVLALAPDAPQRLGELLFGDPLSVSHDDLVLSGTGAAVVLALMAALHRPLAACAFDPELSATLGASARATGLALLLLLAATTLLAVQALGNLLVIALIVAPAAAALRLTRQLGTALAAAGALGVLSGAAGLYASYYLEIAAGAAIALAALATFLLALLSPRRA
ncbi:MAG TPA: metal ABC transporter permease [Solirubrobacterales bacterium]|jgi:ABC-type Mn2+/Zn2+ transport system permease subunit